MNSFIDTIDFNAATITKEEYHFLSNFLKDEKIKNVLEFGPGISTYCFIENDCNVSSVECDVKWYDKYKEVFKIYDKIDIIYNDFRKKGFLEIGEIEEKSYDIVFVDSPPAQAPFARLNTLLYAFEKSDTILLHDCRRYAEENSLKLLGRLYQFDTEVFSKGKGIAILKRTSNDKN